MKIKIREEVYQVFSPFLADFRPVKHRLKDIMSGIMWVLVTGSQWQYLPDEYPPRSTCHFWFAKLVRRGVLEDVFRALVQTLEASARLDLRECSVDATFLRARATRDLKGNTKCGKGHKLMAILEHGLGAPIALFLSSASPHEITLLKATVEQLATEANPELLLADKAFDSDTADADMAEQEIALVAPHRKNRTAPKTQDGRTLRRYKKRWKIEQFFAHLHNYRKITLCYEKHAHIFFGFILLAAINLIINKI